MQRMPTRVRTRLALEAERANQEQLVKAGRFVREARHRRRGTQRELGAAVGLSQAAISRLESGRGGGLTFDLWQRIAIALGITLRVTFQRDPLAETADAGHLAMQELSLRLGRRAGYTGTAELPTKPADPWRSIDVCLVDDRARRIIVDECWNTFGDVGSAARVSKRKLAEARELAIARWGAAEHQVGLVWIVRGTAANRALIGRYPEVFASLLPASSAAWLRALTAGGDLPAQSGLVWCDVDAMRLSAWRRR